MFLSFKFLFNIYANIIQKDFNTNIPIANKNVQKKEKEEREKTNKHKSQPINSAAHLPALNTMVTGKKIYIQYIYSI